MHKKESVLMAATVLLLCFGLIWAGCGSSGGGSGVPPNTPITTDADGAKAATLTNSVATDTLATALSFSGMGSGSGFVAPRLKNTPLIAKAKPSRAIESLTRKMAPMVKKARALTAAQKAPISETFNCENLGGTMVFFINIDDVTGAGDGSGYFQFNNCRLGTDIFQGKMTWPATNPNASTVTFTIGESNAIPFTITSKSWDLGETLSVNTTHMTMRYTESWTSALTETMVLTGWTQEAGYATNNPTGERWRSDVVGFTIRVVWHWDAELINSVLYDVYNITLSGTWADSYFAANNVSTTPDWSQTQKFYSLGMTYKNYWWNDGTYPDYFAIDGTVTVTSTPATPCLDGTYTFDTITLVKVDVTTGETSAGYIVINGNVDVVYETDGTVSVTVNDGTPINYTMDVLEGLCPI